MQQEFSHLQIEKRFSGCYSSPMSLTINIKKLREDQGLNQRELAEMVGISNVHVSQIERGIKNLNNHLIERFAKALNVPPEVIITDSDSSFFHFENMMRRLSPDDVERVRVFAEALLKSQKETARTE
jgi:transcriptional regulator with XRE-family HTH domain